MHLWNAYTRLANFGEVVEINFYYYNEKDEMVLLTAEGAQILPPGSSSEHLEAVRLKRGQAQGLMDSLWTCGLRPSEGTGSAGAMSAAQEHIKDLQSVYKKLFELIEGLYPGKQFGPGEPVQVPLGTLERLHKES